MEWGRAVWDRDASGVESRAAASFPPVSTVEDAMRWVWPLAMCYSYRHTLTALR